MARWKNQYWFNENASKFHERFRQFLLHEPRLYRFKCYQEVNVRDLCPTYKYHNHHYDWYIEELGWVIELHGVQHYKPTKFGKIGFDDLVLGFRNQQSRDSEKLIAAIKEGFSYISIPYTAQKHLSFKLLEELIYDPSKETESTTPS